MSNNYLYGIDLPGIYQNISTLQTAQARRNAMSQEMDLRERAEERAAEKWETTKKMRAAAEARRKAAAARAARSRADTNTLNAYFMGDILGGGEENYGENIPDTKGEQPTTPQAQTIEQPTEQPQPQAAAELQPGTNAIAQAMAEETGIPEGADTGAQEMLASGGAVKIDATPDIEASQLAEEPEKTGETTGKMAQKEWGAVIKGKGKNIAAKPNAKSRATGITYNVYKQPMSIDVNRMPKQVRDALARNPGYVSTLAKNLQAARANQRVYMQQLALLRETNPNLSDKELDILARTKADKFKTYTDILKNANEEQRKAYEAATKRMAQVGMGILRMPPEQQPRAYARLRDGIITKAPRNKQKELAEEIPAQWGPDAKQYLTMKMYEADTTFNLLGDFQKAEMKSKSTGGLKAADRNYIAKRAAQAFGGTYDDLTGQIRGIKENRLGDFNWVQDETVRRVNKSGRDYQEVLSEVLSEAGVPTAPGRKVSAAKVETPSAEVTAATSTEIKEALKNVKPGIYKKGDEVWRKKIDGTIVKLRKKAK